MQVPNLTASLLQGPLVTLRYDRFALALHSRIQTPDGLPQPSIRHSTAKADLRRFYEKNNDASTLFDPKEKKYQEIICSLRAAKRFHDELFFFGGFFTEI